MGRSTLYVVLATAVFALGASHFAATDAEDALPTTAFAIDPGPLGIGRMAPAVSLVDLGGKTLKLLDVKGSAIVVAFTSATCPVAMKLGPTLGALEREFRPRGVAFVYVNPTAAETPAQMRAYVRDMGLSGRYAPDPKGDAAAALGARTTTDVFVFDAGRTLVYQGAVDDQYGIGTAKAEPRQRFVADAIEAALAGRRPDIEATVAPGCLLTKGTPPARGPVTYYKDVSRILQRRCVPCHTEGGVAPFRLDRYEDARSRAAMLTAVVDAGIMPPWFAAPPKRGAESPWRNDRSLTAEEKRTLGEWSRAGAPAGDKSDAPKPLPIRGLWEIGEPDVVLEMPREISIPASGVVPYQYAIVDTAFTEDRWIRAVEVMPGDKTVVHHVLVFVMPPLRYAQSRRDNLTEPLDERRGYLAGFAPGTGAGVFPEGYAKRVPAGSRLLFQIHYTPSGRATKDRTRLGLVFAKSKPAYEVVTRGIANTQFRIPPGDANHRVNAAMTMPEDARILGFFPHMHLRGKAFRYELEAEGEKRVLLDVPRFDFNWQLYYELRNPLPVAKGVRITATGWFDNSEDNAANPDPTATVRWGPQTFEEMMLGYVEYVRPAP